MYSAISASLQTSLLNQIIQHQTHKTIFYARIYRLIVCVDNRCSYGKINNTDSFFPTCSLFFAFQVHLGANMLTNDISQLFQRCLNSQQSQLIEDGYHDVRSPKVFQNDILLRSRQWDSKYHLCTERTQILILKKDVISGKCFIEDQATEIINFVEE